jgi:Tol biopolymer transport system component
MVNDARSCGLFVSTVSALLLSTSVHGHPVVDAPVTRLWGAAASGPAARLTTQDTAAATIVEGADLVDLQGLDDPPVSPQGPPPNLKGGAFQPLIERMWRASPTFRQQCARLAAVPELRITVRADFRQSRSDSRAFTTMQRRNGRFTSAEVVLRVPDQTVELIAHELEHVVEQLDGVEPYRDTCAKYRSTSRGYESCRAVEMGRRVAREVEEAGRTRLLSVRQRDAVSAPLDQATASVSASGRFVAFLSAARLLPAGPHGRHLYVLDLETGRLDLESARPGWPSPSDAYSTPMISADGSVLVVDMWIWDETPLNQSCRKVVVLHRPTGRVRVPDVEAEVTWGCRHTHRPVVSADGTTIVFESIPHPRTSGDRPTTDVYLLRLHSGVVEQVNVPSRERADARNSDLRGHSMTPSVSADGRYVAFTSRVDLTCDTGRDCNRQTGGDKAFANIYVRDTMVGVTTRVSQSLNGSEPNGPSSWPAISADGRYVAFTSEASNLVKGDRNGQPDIFVRDRLTGTNELISRRPDARPGNDASWFPAISGDGSLVAFQSLASDLICARRCTEHDRDINLLWDVFVFDRRTGAMTRASADDTGEWMASSRRPSLDHTGRVLAFSSRHPMHEHDVGHDDDLYIRIRGDRR